MKIDGAGAENLIEKYYNVIFFIISFVFFVRIYINISDPQNPKSLIELTLYFAIFIVLISLSKNLNGGRKKKFFFLTITTIIPWLFLLLVWLGK